MISLKSFCGYCWLFIVLLFVWSVTLTIDAIFIFGVISNHRGNSIIPIFAIFCSITFKDTMAVRLTRFLWKYRFSLFKIQPYYV